MVLTAFMVICILGAGFLTTFFVALCKDLKRTQKCHVVQVEGLIGAVHELDIDRPYSQNIRSVGRESAVSLEQRKRTNSAARGVATGTPGAAD